MEQIEQIEAIRAYMATNLPSELVSRSLAPFASYLGEPPITLDSKELGVYLAEGTDDDSQVSDGYVIQAQLPGILNPASYHSAIWKILKKLDPLTLGASTKSLSWIAFYPGEAEDGGAGSFLVYEVQLSSIIDDCEIYYIS